MDSLRLAIERCERELAEIDTRADLDTSPAYLSAMGRMDWQMERALIERSSINVHSAPVFTRFFRA